MNAAGPIPAGARPYLLGAVVGLAFVGGHALARFAPSLPHFCRCDHATPKPGPDPGPGPSPFPKPDFLPDGPPPPPPFVPDPMASPWEWRPWEQNPKWELHGRVVNGEFLVKEWRPVDAR